LREQVAALEERLRDLATARRIVAPMLARHYQPEQAPSGSTPDAPAHASLAGAVPAPKPVTPTTRATRATGSTRSGPPPNAPYSATNRI
jgi:hypothetical protein